MRLATAEILLLSFVVAISNLVPYTWNSFEDSIYTDHMGNPIASFYGTPVSFGTPEEIKRDLVILFDVHARTPKHTAKQNFKKSK